MSIFPDNRNRRKYQSDQKEGPEHCHVQTTDQMDENQGADCACDIDCTDPGVHQSDSGFSVGYQICASKNAVIQTEDLSDFFADYEGCFVLYDSNADTWTIYDETLATKRFSPNSTYKIYSALFALENGLIRPDDSTLKWDGQSHSYPSWNQDQTLTSAMQNSVNWYFQELDRRADWDALNQFYQTIGYGNEDLSGGAAEFWLESSLKISAVEQVELLKKLYGNEFHFNERNVQAVKDSLKLSASGQTVLSGKTGTGVINGESINGWFVGYVESGSNTCFFATNIQGDDHADSVTAGEITRNILAAKQVYTETE